MRAGKLISIDITAFIIYNIGKVVRLLKKLLILTLLIITSVMTTAFAAYNVETDDDEYVSDSIYFSHRCTWGYIPAERINLKKGRITFYEGSHVSEKIETDVMPINATDKKVRFKTRDVTIAQVDANGVVTPTGKAGETIIDITCGKAKSRMKISVIKPVKGVAISQGTLTLYADKPVAAQLEALVSPDDATVKDIIWTSGDESIAYVDKDGFVYPNGVGSTEIIAETVDGGYKASCAVTVTTWEKRKDDIPVTYSSYNITVEEMAEKQMSASPTVFTTGIYAATEEEVLSFVNPENLVGSYNKYQFLDLGEQNGISAETLDAYLKGKGVLSGKGDVFKAAAEENNISEVYLVIHACLESGSGMSTLANGVDFDGTVVYNLFGIGAVDSDPIYGGASYAYSEGWTTVEDAIWGGAKWISENYINNRNYRQNTLYKMRWNPESPANHQYATDIEWPSKQAEDMAAMFEAFPSASYRYEIPVYRGMKKPRIR